MILENTKNLMLSTALTVAVLLTGCSGVGIPYSSKPITKLQQADYLLNEENRPLAAERLIMEATALYKAENDQNGLGKSYRNYADLIISPAINDKWKNHYIKHGFVDKTVTYDNRLEKANDYYKLSASHFKLAEQQDLAAQKYDILTNTYYNLASMTIINFNNLEQGCYYYDRMQWAYEQNMKQNPDARPYSTNGTMTELIARDKKSAGCP